MNLFNKLMGRLRTKQQAPPPSAQLTQMLPLTAPAFTPATYKELSKQGYKRNVIVYRCIRLITDGLAAVPWQLDPGSAEQAPFSYLAALLEHPNPGQSWSHFIANITLHLLIGGNAFIKVVNDDNGQPIALYAYNPTHVNTRVYNNHIQYMVQEGDRRCLYNRYGPDAGILHLKFQHPDYDTQGLSPLEVCQAAADQHNAVGAHNLSILQNGGRPSGALIWKNNDGFPLTEEERDYMQQNLRQTLEGGRNAGRIMVMEGDFEWKEMGLSPKDLDFTEGKYMSAREIALAFGVPPLLAGVAGEATYSNYKEARLHLWEETILPMLHMLQQELALYFNGYGNGAPVKFSYDINKILPLQQKRESLWQRVQQADFLTRAEKRHMLGFPTEPEGGDHV